MPDESGHNDMKYGFITWGKIQPPTICQTCHASLDIANSKFTLSSERDVTVKLRLHKKGDHNVFTINEV
jgi:hypothetical protein